MAGDWIKLHRKTLESQVFSDADLFHLWAYLLLRANYKPSYFRGQKIDAGQVAFSQRVVCELLHISRGKLQRAIAKLVDIGCIDLETSRDFSVVTINQWSTYQTVDDSDRATTGTTDETTGRTTDGTTNGTIPKKERTLRREEGKKPDSSEPAVGDSEPALLVFPTVGRGSRTWGLTQATVDSLAAAFPGVDIMAQCRKALGWCEANAAKRKTPKGMPKFLFGWMERNQNRSPIAGSHGDPRGNLALRERLLAQGTRNAQ